MASSKVKSQALSLVEALISSSFDKDAGAKQAICDSLSFFGKKQPNLVLNAVYFFLVNHSKIDLMHRLLLLNCMKNIVDQCGVIDDEIARKIVTLAAEDLTNSKKLNKDCQNAASNLLTSLGHSHLVKVIEELLKKFVPGIVAHQFVVQTLGQLATSNVSGMMNHMNYVIATSVSQISSVKSDTLRIIFATSFGNYSDCICELYSNPDLSQDLPKGTFSSQMNTAFDVMFNGWLYSKNLKVQCAVIEALGKIGLLLPQKELEEIAPKFISSLIGIYRRLPQNSLIITSALCNVITSLTEKDSNFPESTLEQLTTNLHGQVCNMPDEAPPPVTRNYNEVLRCFGILASSYPATLISMILLRIEAREERVRAGNILILKHLINSNSTTMKENQDMIITGFHKSLYDSSNRVKCNLAKLIITMGTHGLLDREGGLEYIKFILRQCTLPSYDVPSKVPVTVTNEQLRDICNDILLLLTTTVDDADKVLWPYLFEFITDRNFTNALGVIIRSLSVLAQSKKEAAPVKSNETGDEVKTVEPMIDFHSVANIPQPTGILSRFLVMLAEPMQKRMHADAFLTLLHDIGSCLHLKLPGLFDQKIPAILTFLKEHNTSQSQWPQDEWEEIILQFLADILDEVGDEEWSCLFAQSITSQWPLYEFLPEYKSFAFKCLGVVLQKINNKEFVASYLALLFLTVNHAIPDERQGVAMCLGRCALIHLDAVLDKLSIFVTTNITKKESSYLSMFKSERSLTEIEQYKGTAALSCGYIAYHAPSDLVQSRLEITITKIITGLSKNLKATNMRIEWVTGVYLIALSLDPDRFSNASNQPRYVFAAREDLINKLLDYLKDDLAEKATKLKVNILRACAALVKLDPPMSTVDVASTIKRSLNHVVPLYKSPDQDKILKSTCISYLNKLLEEILKKRPNSNGLLTIFRHLEPYLTSTSDYERLAAIEMTRSILEKFRQVAVRIETANILANTGLLIARTLPCCCDPLPSVRLEALLCVRQLLVLLDRHPDGSYDDDKLSVLDSISEKLLSEHEQEIDEAVTQLSKILCNKLPSDLLLFQLGSLTVCLLDALSWPQHTSVKAACLVLAYIFESRGSMFAAQIDDIISVLVGKLTEMFEKERDGSLKDLILNLVSLITHHHLHASINALLLFPLPYSTVITSCWRRLGSGKSWERILDYLLDHLERSLPYDEAMKKKGKPKQGSLKTATKSSLAITCALHEILKSLFSNTTRDNNTVSKYRYRLISISLIRVGSMYDVLIPPKIKMDPYKEAVDLLQTILTSLCDPKMTFDLEQSGIWKALESKNDLTILSFAVSCVVRQLSKHQNNDVPHIVTSLNNYLPSIYDMQRFVSVAFFAQLVQECSSHHDEILLEISMNNLRSRLIDSHNFVRQLCIVGLSNIVYAPQDQIDRYSTTVLSAMMSGMDDNDDPDFSISLAAMSGLALFLNKADKVNIESMFVNICLRARPCFEKDEPRVRSAAFHLFGALAKFANHDLQATFAEQAHSNLISILMHLNDEDDEVKKSCKTTLRELGRHIGSESIKELFEKVLLEETALHYGEFMNNLAKLMVNSFPDKINFYLMECVSFFKSSSPVIRCNSAMVSGFLMNSLEEDDRSSINYEHICAALIQLLKDSSPVVRSKVAEAISLLFSY